MQHGRSRSLLNDGRMSSMFDVAGDAYDRFMGRYSKLLAPAFADFAGVEAGANALDVGCGPGALTTELVRRLGAENVKAADPSPPFVAELHERLPDVDVREVPAEQLPWGDGFFDVALAQLVVSFMRDAPTAVREMRRVTRPGGVVAACMWDAAGGMEMLKLFWDSVRDVDGSSPSADESRMKYRTEPELRDLWHEVGLADVKTDMLAVVAAYESFDEFWGALQFRVGPIGEYFAKLGDESRARLHEVLRERLGNPSGTFELTGRAWAVRGRA
jgi:ubiquinone/menaquinone biosynthesis C-methylase UbiE